MSELIAIAVCVFVGLILLGIIIYLACWKLQCHSKHKEASKINGMTGIEEIGSPEAKRRASFTGQLPGLTPEAIRAQKFRERARDTTVGTPAFRVSNKYKNNRDIYTALGNRPDLEEFQQEGVPGSKKYKSCDGVSLQDVKDHSAGSSETVVSDQQLVSEEKAWDDERFEV